MAGDWIKMRTCLATDPAVIGIASSLDINEFEVVGMLHHLWAWADTQSRDGHAAGVTAKWINRFCQRDGFAEQMQKAGWLEITESGITLPNFDRHNGEPAKTRALATNRKKKQRSNVTEETGQVSRNERDESVTREEKRREEEESKAIVPSADDTSGYSSEFEQFWKAYPKRDGGNSKKGAFKAWKARLRAGAKVDDLILSASRYAEHMAVQGRTGTSFVKQASTFLGPDDHWQEALTSNVHPTAKARNGSRPALKPGEFYDLEWDDKNPATHKIYHSDTHDPTTGYAWVWLKKQTWYRP